MDNSRDESTCARDEDCATVTNPSTLDDEARLVVRRVDAAGLDGVAKRHLAVCGATRRSSFSPDVFSMVDAKCVAARCTQVETTFHPDPIE